MTSSPKRGRPRLSADDETSTITIRIRSQLLAELSALAVRERSTVSDLLRKAAEGLVGSTAGSTTAARPKTKKPRT